MLRYKEIIKIISMPVLFSSLCCLSPLLLVIFGLSTASFAASLTDTLYGTYRWVFRGVGLLLLAVSLFFYFYKQKGICSLDQAKRRKNEILNIVLVALILGAIAYVFWLYVVVELVGKIYKIW